MNQKCIRLCVFTALASLICAAGAQHAAAQSPLVGADTPLRADLNEAVYFIPVTVTGLHGLTRSGLFIVTSYHPSGTGPFPAIVYSHGRMV
jgi:hypothetical protein